MKTNIKPENRRLLEALYYIDEEVLSDVIADVRVPDTAPETSKSRAFMRSLRYAALIAACALLLGAIFPVVMNLIAYFGEGTGTNPPALSPGAPEYLKCSEYVLTKSDLAAINSAWKAKFGVKFADSIEKAMTRTRHGSHYFGKYGDTLVFWRAGEADVVLNLQLGNYEFSFSSGGQLWLFNDSEVYNSTAASGLLSEQEADALYEYYSEEYLYYNDDWNDYSYPMFAPDLEYLSQKTMARINEDYYAWKYRELYEEYFRGVEPSEIPEVDPVASAYAFKQLGDDKYRFFNPKKCDLYQYYGKFGDCVMLATETVHYNLTSISVVGYEFHFGGSGELIVWRDGEIMHIGEAFEAGYLTVEDIGKAYERYLAYQEYLKESTYDISEGTATEQTIELTTEPEQTTQAAETLPSSPIYSFSSNMSANSILEATKEGGWCVKYDGEIIVGAELWDAFLASCEQNIPCQLYSASYSSYEGNVKDTWIESEKRKYPRIQLSELIYDGNMFYYSYRHSTSTGTAAVNAFKYMVRYENDGKYVYVLCNDNTKTYQQMLNMLFSSSYIADWAIAMTIPIK